MGEDVSDMATTTSQLQAKLLALTGGQVDIMLDANTFKNSTQILREMANAWEDMTDIQRASALELMGGKRQANVLSALIQNFDTVEKVIETSANSAGSALKENERYLDSIQGKIDQFNNAMQAMWSNTLDSDVVKWFVSIGTELIKIVDTIGLIPSILTAILTYKLAVGAIKMFDLTSLGTYISMLFTANSVTEVQGLWINKTALAQKLLNSTLIQAQAARMGLTAADLAGYSVTQLLTLGVQGLAAGFKNLWIAMGPVGWTILAIVGAATAFTLIFNAVHKTTEELTEELNNLKSELSDIRSELDSVNSELETTNERMAELLAKDKLTFEEQEELDRLRATNDELERRKELLKDEEKNKTERVGRQAARVVDSSKKDNPWWQDWLHYGGGIVGYGISKAIGSQDDKADRNIEDYKEIKSKFDNAKSLKEQEKYQKKLDKEADKIDAYILELSEALDGIEYGDSEESDAALDYLAELESKYAIARGSEKAKSSAIKGVLVKDEFAETKAAIDGYVDALEKGDKSAADSIAKIINDNANLVEDLKARGVEAQDAIDYYTMLGSEANYATIDGKIKELSRAAETFESLIDGGMFKVDGIDIGLAGLFDEEGKIIQTKLSQVFNDTSAQTREDITNLLEGSYNQIKNGTVDTERLLTGFGLKTAQQVLEIQNKVLGDQNLELFPNLKDEINGIIDTFSEFSKAVGGVVDALDTLEQARAEQAYSGSISIETLENLMKYTDDYAQLVEIDETGAITLATNAEEILIGQRLEKIKTDAAAAVQTAQANLAQAEYNAKAVNETGPVQEALTSATDTLAGSWAYLGSLIGDVTDGNFKGMFARASDAYSKVTAGREEKRAQVNVSVEDAQKALDKALHQQKIADALTSDNVKTKHSSDEASGGNATKEDAEKSKLDELMEDFQRDMDYWENRIGANQARYEQLQNEIDLLEAKGQKADASYYDEQIKLENERKWLLEKQRGEASLYLAMLEEGSEEWWEVANTLNDIEGELDDATASIVDLQDAIGEIDTYKFEEFNTRLDDITSKLGTIRDLIAPDGEEDWFDDEGNWTEEGVAVLGTYIQELETHKQGLAEAEKAYANYVNEYVGNEEYYAKLGIHSEQELYDKRQELIEQQYDYAQSISDTEQSVVDMYESNIDAVEEYTESLIDSYNDYIDSVKEALDAERDLYDFKKKIKNQTKEIATIERRIASLSGSTNASDIAERRRLEADLYGAREDLDDTYYDHAKTTQQEALDNEAAAYEETMTRFVDGLRLGLDQATANMDEFLMSVTSMVTLNADTVLTKYQETELPLGDAITNPWEAAKTAVGDYSGDALDLMNKWTQGGFFTTFPETVKGSLTSPWTAGSNAASAFETSVGTVMDNVVSKIETNVQSAATKLSDLYQQILDTEKKAAEVDVTVDDDTDDTEQNYDTTHTPTSTPTQTTPKKDSNTIRAASPKRPKFKKVGDLWSGVGHTGVSIGKKTYNKALEIEGDSGIFYPYKNGAGYQGYIKKGEGYTVLSNGKMDIHSMKPLYQKYAKGTTSTTRDEWALTDEPQFGDELVLVPGKDGNLSFMRKGTGVVPADMTQKLFELAQIPTSDLMNKNLTAIVPNITKNDFKNEFNFESLVHVDTVDSDTLPKLEKMVDKKIDDFSKALNYSLKRFAR